MKVNSVIDVYVSIRYVILKIFEENYWYKYYMYKYGWFI